jgi:hypothetical protein
MFAATPQMNIEPPEYRTVRRDIPTDTLERVIERANESHHNQNDSPRP